MFLLKHQDEDIEYELNSGGYVVESDKLYLSIEARGIAKDAFPDTYLFAIDGYSIPEELDDTEVKITTNPLDEPPNVYVYTTFHACEVEATLRMQACSKDELEVSVEILSDDVIYYDDRAKQNLFTGKAKLSVREKSELWLPS